MGCRKFEFKEFVLVHHALVDYFMMNGGVQDQPSQEAVVVTVVEPQAQAKEIGLETTSYSP
jgi:hypothetical protein